MLLDISHRLLEIAEENTRSTKISLLEQDVGSPWQLKKSSVDVIYSNMMFNELTEVDFPFREAARVLKPNGKFIFSIVHPAWDLFIHAQELMGKKSKKMKGLGGYFVRKSVTFMAGLQSASDVGQIKKFKKDFRLPHFHRPIADYFESVTKAGFRVNKLIEPEPTKELLEENPKFKKYRAHPIGLIFCCQKTI